MIPPGADTVLVRHGELGTKSSQVQHRLERLLGSNIERMLADRDIPGDVAIEHGRLFIQAPTSELSRALDTAIDTFGVISASPAVTVEPTMEAITGALSNCAAEREEASSFAVRARRAGSTDDHPFTSQEIEQEGGSAVWAALEDPVVDLENPEQTYYVECREDAAYVFLEKHDGPGGFPYGCQGTVVGLISGGIDSPVAAWEMMRRGCTLVPVYFDFEDYGGPDHVARAYESVRHLAKYAPDGRLDLHHVPIGAPVEQLCASTQATRMLSLRRFMFSVAERIADEVEAHALSTGESLGQKSSQTGPNLAIGGAHLRYPIHRPLLGMDKEQIIDRAKSLGTFQDSTIDAGCNRVAPTHPETAGTLAEVLADEPSGFLQQVDAVLEHRHTKTIERHCLAPQPIAPNGQP